MRFVKITMNIGKSKLFPQRSARRIQDDKSFDAKVKVLQEDVEHHVKEEEGEMFPDAREFLGKERLNLWVIR
jgi:hypothetical protein